MNIQSTRVQQNFGEIMELALQQEDVIVERYGAPRVVILSFERYLNLLESEKNWIKLRLQQASALAESRAAYLTDEEVDEMIERARQEVHDEQSGRDAPRA